MTPRDLFRDSPAAIAQAHRAAAETARRSPFETPEAAERRARWHEAQAEQLERQVAA